MGLIIGVGSQKGGVCKSSISRSLGTTYAASGWNVKIADCDISQSTSYKWHLRRLERGTSPVVAVETFGSVAQALKIADNYDLMIFDGAPTATRATQDVAAASDLMILPTGLSIDDMEPQVQLANELVAAGIPVERLAFVLAKTGDSPAELEEARDYLAQTPYYVVPGQIPEKTAFRRAQDAGLSLVETPYRGPREAADAVIQGIIDRLEELTN